MRTISQSPAYNLKAALKETGLTADVLRAWERRYGLPKPQRTPGGHRLYSEYDIETIKWLRARLAEGLSISRAVKSWNDIVEAGRDPLMEQLQAGAARDFDSVPAAQAHIEVLRRQWLEAALAFDARRAEEVLNQAFAMYPTETVCIEILQQGMSMIGSEWYSDRVTVQQEHFASALAVRRLETLITLTPRPTRSQTVLIGCPPGEWHTFPVLLLNMLLRRSRLNVVYLGANIPIERLEETAAAIQPNLVVLAAQQLTTAAALRPAALALRAKGIPAAYGGLIFNRIPELRKRIPAHFLGESLEGSLQRIERLILAPEIAPDGSSVENPYQELADLYQEKRPLIELDVYGMLQEADMPMEYLPDANAFFGNGLTAALELGDPALLEADIEWVKHLLTGRRIPADRLLPFLSVYSQAVEKELGTAGTPITDWIAAFIQRNGIVPANL